MYVLILGYLQLLSIFVAEPNHPVMEESTSYAIFGKAPSNAAVKELLAEITPKIPANLTEAVYRRCFECLDITSLDTADSAESIAKFTRKVVELPKHYPGIGGVASICVYPNFVETVGLEIGNSEISIASVAGGFPSSQTFLEVKMLETAMAVEQGADEVDTVMNVGEIISGEYEVAGSEIALLRAEIGEGVTLKMILESGLLGEAELIYKASMTALGAGADFIKTSTGKSAVGATPEAAIIMCLAIKEFHRRTGSKAGFKAAGGIRTAGEAATYYTIVENILGSEWLNPALFRIGAASLANELLGAITDREERYF